MKIQIIFEYHVSEHWPCVRICFNDILLKDLTDTSAADKKLIFDVVPKDPLNTNVLIIEHYGKQDTDTIIDQKGKILKDRAVEIKSIEIDGFDQPWNLLYSKKFYPIWPKHMKDMPEFITDNLYLGFNGRYIFDFPKNIGQEYYNSLWEQERNINNKLTVVDENKEEWFTSYGLKIKLDEKFDFNLSKLKEIIEKNENI